MLILNLFRYFFFIKVVFKYWYHIIKVLKIFIKLQMKKYAKNFNKEL